MYTPSHCLPPPSHPSLYPLTLSPSPPYTPSHCLPPPSHPSLHLLTHPPSPLPHPPSSLPLSLQMMGRSQTPLKVVQYQFTAWPDHGVPEYVTPMLSFHRRVVSEHKCVRGPMLVHCRCVVCGGGVCVCVWGGGGGGERGVCVYVWFLYTLIVCLTHNQLLSLIPRLS